MKEYSQPCTQLNTAGHYPLPVRDLIPFFLPWPIKKSRNDFDVDFDYEIRALNDIE